MYLGLKPEASAWRRSATAECLGAEHVGGGSGFSRSTLAALAFVAERRIGIALGFNPRSPSPSTSESRSDAMCHATIGWTRLPSVW